MTATEAEARILALLDDVEAGERDRDHPSRPDHRPLIPARGPHALRGQFVGVAMTAGTDDELDLNRRGVEPPVTTVVLDSHVLHWWAAEPARLSGRDRRLKGADELAVASITWFELAWLAAHERITLTIPIPAWLDGLSRQAAPSARRRPSPCGRSLPGTFPGDPADRLIYATAVEQGWPLVTKDERLRAHRHPRQITIW